MGESWCKVASNLDSHPKIRRAGRNGREVFLFALRRNAEPHHATPGMLAADVLEPWYIADQLMMSETEASQGLDAATRAKLLERDGEAWAIVGWDEGEWGREKSTDRVRKWREQQRQKDVAVTDETLRNVSQQSATVGNSKIRGEEKRLEERRGEESVPASPAKPRKAPAVSLPSDWRPTREHIDIAGERGVDVELQARRFRAHAEANDRRQVRWNAAFTQWLLGSRQESRNGKTPIELQLERVAMLEAAERAAQ